MKLRFLLAANLELDEAVRYYEYQLPGLGFRFFQEISASIKLIMFMPSAWTKIGKRTRRCLIKGFPYALLYVNKADEIVITALAHLHRDPDHYKKRII